MYVYRLRYTIYCSQDIYLVTLSIPLFWILQIFQARHRIFFFLLYSSPLWMLSKKTSRTVIIRQPSQLPQKMWDLGLMLCCTLGSTLLVCYAAFQGSLSVASSRSSSPKKMVQYIFFTACYMYVSELHTIVIYCCYKQVSWCHWWPKNKYVNHDHSSLIAMIYSL